MHSPIVIRKALPKDLDALLELSVRLIKFDHQFDPTMDVTWPLSAAGRAFFTAHLASKDSTVIVAELDDAVVGYLVGGKVPADEFRNISFLAELEEIFIEESYRGQAIGAKLWLEFLNWCRQQKLSRITVDVTACNQSAIVFYKKIGFQEQYLSLEMEI